MNQQTAKKIDSSGKESYQTKISEEFELEGLNCSNCALKIEDEVKKIDGLENVKLNFSSSTINLSAEEKEIDKIKEKLQKISDRIEPGVIVKKKDDKIAEPRARYFSLKEMLFKHKSLFTGSLIFLLALVFSDTTYFAGTVYSDYSLVLYITAYLLIGWPVLKAAVLNIGRGQIFDENFLMTTATFGAFAVREYPEAAAVMLFYMVGEMFQEKAVDDSRRSIKELMDIKSDYANLIKDEEIVRVEPEELKIGDQIVVKAGEKIPVDGAVIKGESALDTSALTGESAPRSVKNGDQVLSGMLNLNNLITVEVKKEYRDSTVKKILKLVEDAAAKKAPTEKFITKFSKYYTPFVVFSALLTAVVPPLVMGASFETWIYRALVFLVVSCPCALVVSIPLGFFGGIGLASKNGVLVKGGNYLEALNELDRIVFDKTGTLTKGSFEVNKIIPADSLSSSELLKTAAEIEQFSNHPIAESILKAAGEYKKHSSAEEYEEKSGLGIISVIYGDRYLAGNERLMKNNNIDYRKADEAGTAVYLSKNGDYLGSIIINDTLKSDSEKTVSELKNMDLSQVVMLTGDNETAASQIAAQLKLDSYYAELMPDQKVQKVEAMLSPNSKLAFVGDGINDAPVLARSDLGIAMGALGSDAAVEAADIVLMTDEPAKIVTALKIAALTKKLVWQNITMALGIKAAVMIMSIFGTASIWAAVFADVGVALLAVFNVMRILKWSENYA